MPRQIIARSTLRPQAYIFAQASFKAVAPICGSERVRGESYRIPDESYRLSRWRLIDL